MVSPEDESYKVAASLDSSEGDMGEKSTEEISESGS